MIFTRTDLIERIASDLRLEAGKHDRFKRSFLLMDEDDFLRCFENEAHIKLTRLIKNRYIL